MSAYFLRFEVNYLEKMRVYPHFFFVDSNSTYYDLRSFPPGPNLAQNPWYLVATVLNLRSEN